MDTSNAISVLEKLIETCRDGEKGYSDPAAHVKSHDLRSYFLEQSRQRAQFAQELESELSRLGKAGKKESGSVPGAVHRAWIDVKANLGGGDKSILASVEQGEDNAKETYEKALSTSLPPELASVIRRQAEKGRQAHDKVRTLRDRLAA